MLKAIGLTPGQITFLWSLALIPGGTLVVVAATSIPAWLATRIRTVPALRYE